MKIESISSTVFAVNGEKYQKGDYAIDYNDKRVKIIQKDNGFLIGNGASYTRWDVFRDANNNKFASYQALVDYLADAVLGSVIGQGPQGPQGVPGPVGPAGLTWRGTWLSGGAYVKDDAVGFNGASYFCILATSGTTAPNLATANWALLASQGAQGPQGAQGVQGPQGIQGVQGTSGSVTLPYKKYVALLSQSGTNAPVVTTLLENTLPGTIVWTRTSAGLYYGTLTGAFTNLKTWCMICPISVGATWSLYPTDTNQVQLRTWDDASAVGVDGYLNETSIEIRVYN